MFEFWYHFSWIQENKELKKTIESAVERAYVHGRKVIAVKVQYICTHACIFKLYKALFGKAI